MCGGTGTSPGSIGGKEMNFSILIREQHDNGGNISGTSDFTLRCPAAWACVSSRRSRRYKRPAVREGMNRRR